MGNSGNDPEIGFRCVGFKEVWDLLDLDRFDDILIHDMHLTNERINKKLIELYELPDKKKVTPRGNGVLTPICTSNHGIGKIGKSLGQMDPETAKIKFL
jgi:hypothetical protein